jgi:hypothetical protein
MAERGELLRIAGLRLGCKGRQTRRAILSTLARDTSPYARLRKDTGLEAIEAALLPFLIKGKPKMTEQQIETRVERMFDDLDRRYMNSNSMTADEYERQAKSIDRWADEQYRKRYPQW